MTEKEDFLSRWSRRKQEVARETKPPRSDEATEAANPLDATATGKGQTSFAPDAEAAEPLFDLTKLPSLDSIGPGTDIRIFMQPGVPASLSRAALRRAWSADPAIRDFIGLSENSWDFTKPESIPGFGPLLPIDDVKQLLSQVLRDESEPPLAVEKTQQTALQHVETDGDPSAKASEAPGVAEDLVTDNSTGEASGAIEVRCTENDLAVQQDGSTESDNLIPSKRRHGSALPS
ncbi:MAG: DUF3306 domain-containing protein [Pseudorhodoplanes sp.]